MSLIKCPECGKEVSQYALSCPNCGFPISQISKKENETIPPSSKVGDPNNTQINQLKLAESGNAEACMFCGNSFCDGTDGFPKDLEKAIFYYNKAYECGDPTGKYIALVVKDNAKKALNINEFLEVLNDPKLPDEQRAQLLNRIGVKYSDGLIGLKKDVELGRKYYLKSIEINPEWALKNYLSTFYKDCNELIKILKNPKFQVHTENDAYSHALYNLAISYERGEHGLHKSQEKHDEIRDKLCDDSYECGYWYVNKIDDLIIKGKKDKRILDENLDLAADYCKKGLSKKPFDKKIHGDIHNYLGVILSNISYSKKNPKEAEVHFKEALKTGQKNAQSNLNWLYATYPNLRRIALVQILSTKNQLDASSSIKRGLLGGLLLGPLGAIVGAGSGNNITSTEFLVTYDDGTKEKKLCQDDSDEYKRLIQFLK